MGRLDGGEPRRRTLVTGGLVAGTFGHVLWLGGVSAAGKTTAARRAARRYDLRLYSVDEHLHEHEHRLPPDTRSLDEQWVTPDGEQIAAAFQELARLRFPLVLEDVSLLPADAPLVVEGHALLPDLVAPLLGDPRRALYVVAPAEAQRRQIEERGDALHLRTRDPARALANRLARDALLADVIRRGATVAGLTVVDVSSAAETERAVERWLAPLLARWIAQPDHGDVAARRREMNDTRLAHLRARGESAAVKLSCECSRPGCTATLTLPLPEAAGRRAAGALVYRGHD